MGQLSGVPARTIDGAGHSPHGTHPAQFVATFFDVYDAVCRPCPLAARRIRRRFPDGTLDAYRSSFSPA